METLLPNYAVSRARTLPEGQGLWDGAAWARAPSLDIAQFHPASSAHRPRVQAKMLYDDTHVYGLFRVEDRYVVCRHEGYQVHVYEDSCVEFFVKPKPDSGYMNFEMSCGGSLLLYYIMDWRRKLHPPEPDDEFERFVKVPRALGSRVALFHSLPSRVEPEIEAPTTWTLEFHIPLAVLEQYTGPLGPLSGQTWRANFNKCADACSHPHWAAWASIGEELNLHQPDKFGVLRFE
ncbi:MAG: carbohydrate-binding family 9-like protein [Candidatus Hydrogenedentes bacterium]|nr:carbohydrate-binding family 9-like protein [Candidatus Hydrogenedentota bacterium]